MARKPSQIARHGCAVLSILMVSLVSFRASGQVAVEAAANSAQNPFVQHDAQPLEPMAVEQEQPARGRHFYRNPFVTTPSLPLDLPMRPGPISRWQHTPSQSNQSASAAGAAISVVPAPFGSGRTSDPVGRAAVDWDTLPPIEELRSMRAAPSTAINVSPNSPSTSSSTTGSGGPIHQAPRPPELVHFTPKNLTQPASVEPGEAVARALPPLISQAGPGSIADPFEMSFAEPSDTPATRAKASASINEPAAFRPGGGVKTVEPPATSSLELASPGIMPVIISDSIKTSDEWYERAETMARTAATPDDFTAVADLCQQGLQCGPAPQTSASLRRLAAWAHNRCGEVMSEAGKDAPALAEFQAAIGLDPTCALALHNRGVSFAQRSGPRRRCETSIA